MQRSIRVAEDAWAEKHANMQTNSGTREAWHTIGGAIESALALTSPGTPTNRVEPGAAVVPSHQQHLAARHGHGRRRGRRHQRRSGRHVQRQRGLPHRRRLCCLPGAGNGARRGCRRRCHPTRQLPRLLLRRMLLMRSSRRRAPGLPCRCRQRRRAAAERCECRRGLLLEGHEFRLQGEQLASQGDAGGTQAGILLLKLRQRLRQGRGERRGWGQRGAG